MGPCHHHHPWHASLAAIAIRMQFDGWRLNRLLSSEPARQGLGPCCEDWCEYIWNLRQNFEGKKGSELTILRLFRSKAKLWGTPVAAKSNLAWQKCDHFFAGVIAPYDISQYTQPDFILLIEVLEFKRGCTRAWTKGVTCPTPILTKTGVLVGNDPKPTPEVLFRQVVSENF